jgi:hypothetical protein
MDFFIISMTKDQKWIKNSRPTPQAFLTKAKEYNLAAETLMESKKQVDDPIYFLYSHSIESALKAFLNLNIPKTRNYHRLDMLVKECLSIGLNIDQSLQNLLSILGEETEVHGFRYFNSKSAGRPSLKWLSEGTKEILSVVEFEFSTKDEPNQSDVVLKFTIGRPEKK